jgi:hypothetical protein
MNYNTYSSTAFKLVHFGDELFLYQTHLVSKYQLQILEYTVQYLVS